MNSYLSYTTISPTMIWNGDAKEEVVDSFRSKRTYKATSEFIITANITMQA
jgi:hypothetical protein